MKIKIYLIHILFFSFIVLINSAKQECYEYSCEECLSSEYGTCTKCRDDFKLIDGTCPCSFSSCALCTTGLAGLNICEQCKEGYYSSNKNCYCEVNNCEQCAVDGCKKCNSGYYYNETTKECLKETEDNKLQCFDPNCDGCFSDEKGACQSCKEGYYEKKGECIALENTVNGGCLDNNYYPIGNYCYEKCNGISCGIFAGFQWPNFVFRCAENNCLVCIGYNLLIISECDNSDVCNELEGCLNCLTKDECLICQQGYYLLGGKCKKCSQGCSICSSVNNCQVCMSGYELTSNKTCELTYTFDYNTDLYELKKTELIPIYYPEEIPKPTTIPKVETTTPIISTQHITNSNLEKETNTNKITDKAEENKENEEPKMDSTAINKIDEINSRTYIKIQETTELNISPTTQNKIDEDILSKIKLDSIIIEEIKEFLKYNKINLCDKNCIKCYDNTGKCKECIPNYALKDDKCNLICSDKNCENCELKDGKEICNNCLTGFELKENKCNLICSIAQCSSCSLKDNILICNYCNSGFDLKDNKCKIKCEDINCNECSDDGKECLECNKYTHLIRGKCAKKKDMCISYYFCNYCFDDEGCVECQEGYEIRDKKCYQKKNNKLFIIILIIAFIMVVAVIFFCIYTRRKERARMRVVGYAYDQQSDFQNYNQAQVYNVRNQLNLSNSMRSALSKDELAEEYEEQRRKYNKAKMPCIFCKKKQGIFKCDCGCIVCKEHSNLKEVKNEKEEYKACFNCGKKVDKVNQIKYNCNICMQNKNSVTHFKCGCAMEVCKNCYIMCKMTNDKCPGCRAVI